MKKIMIVFGTRPEAIKMCPLILEIKKRSNFEVVVCVTAQHRQMLDQVLGLFEIVPDYDLNIMKDRQTLFDITTNVLNGIKEILEKEKPDVVLVHGDTSTTFVTALACFYLQIPVGHVEAGLRTYNIYSPYPEEFNRQGVGIISTYNFAPTPLAKENLLREGKKEENIFVTGNTVIDAMRHTVREDYSHPELEWIGDSKLIFITAHRRENLGEPMINIAFDAEKNYVGVNVGTLDQSCEVLSKKDHLLYLDCADNRYELIPTNPAMKPYRIAIFFSGLEHSLAGSKYNMRVDELRAGVYALQAFSGYEYGKFNQANARDVSWNVYQTYKDRLPASWAKRCEHWYTEFRRVEAGAEAWRRGDIEEYGRLSFESGWSSIHNWESGAPEQIRLYEIMRETDGIYGGRFSGAGFKGCCMALINPDKADSIQETVERKYLDSFPEMKGKYSFHLCESADGIGEAL